MRYAQMNHDGLNEKRSGQTTQREATCQQGEPCGDTDSCPDPVGCGFQDVSKTTEAEIDEPAFGSRDYYLAQATTDVHEAWVAVQAGNWLRADLYLKLAIDEIKDAGVLP
jgi:hypothetical protein